MLKWIHVFGEMDMHIWLCKDTGTMNRSPAPDGMFATNFVGERHPFCEYAMRHRKLGVTCLFCGCYVFRKQKGGFCNIKTPFLHYKNHTFKTQQYSYGGAPTILAKCNAHILAQQTRYFCFAKTILCACNALFMSYLETA